MGLCNGPLRCFDVEQTKAQVTASNCRRVGVDFAPRMIAQAQQNFPRIEFQEGDAPADA